MWGGGGARFDMTADLMVPGKIGLGGSHNRGSETREKAKQGTEVKFADVVRDLFLKKREKKEKPTYEAKAGG